MDGGFEVLRSTEQRLSYLVTCLMAGLGSDEEFDEWYEKIKTFLENNNVEVEDYEPGNDFWSEGNIHHLDGYVDHPSDYINRAKEIISDEKLLYDYLFNGKSIVIIGNDNGENHYDAPSSWSYEKEIKNQVW